VNEVVGTVAAFAPATRRSMRFPRHWRIGLTSAAGVLLLAAVWELAGRTGLANGFVLTPGQALGALLDPERRDLYLRAAGSTFASAGQGLLIGGALAALSALLAHQVRPLRRIVDQFAALANSAPWVAVGPVVLVVAGRESGPVAIAVLAVYFYFFVAISVGLSASEGTLRELFLSSGSSRWLTIRYLILPRALPSLAEGFKLAAPAAIAGTIYGEWYGSTSGIGVLLISGMQSGNAEGLWAASILAATGGMLAYAIAGGAQLLLRRRYGSGIAAGAAAAAEAWPRRVTRTALEVVGLTVLLLAIWQAWVSFGKVSPLIAPAPLTVFTDLASRPAEYLALVGQTCATAGLALVIGIVMGATLAGIARLSSLGAAIVVPAMVLLTATPLIALFPLLARIFGYGGGTVVVIAAILVVLPAFVYTRSGLTAAAAQHLELARSLGAREGEIFRWIGLPSALPHISTGIRIAASSAIIATVIGESLIGTTGLGVDFSYQYRLLNMAPAFGSAVLIVLLSLLVFTIFGWLDRMVRTHWGTGR
jgi:sulfonate transport system permease protein